VALVVLRAAPGQRVSRRLAGLLLVEGTAVITTELGILLLVESDRTGLLVSLIHAGADLLVLALYPPFLAAALSVPMVRVFGTRAAGVASLLLGIAGGLAIAVFPSAFISDAVRLPGDGPVRWLFSWGPMWLVIAIGIVAMYAFGIVASASALRRATRHAAALESAYQDAELTPRERAMLSSVAESLGLHPEDAERLERDVRARAGT
jgi:hypothetical protein